ncbi:MAG: hypothetical protein HYT88_03630, partial [Candidatus Omnitrophica bacterium]|nr:hypothetical protein [Candidatus Omnitrophota bacterium]
VVNSHFHDLTALWRLDAAKEALGALGINLHGDDNEVGYNLFERNSAQCTMSDGNVQHYSAPFEIFNANRSLIHHNRAFDHRKHAEFGHDATHTSDDNVLAYNLFVSPRPDAVGPNIHGAANLFGPVNRTKIYNNTILFTGSGSQALVCDCSGDATILNNILVADWKAGFYKGVFTESNTIYWRVVGAPLVQFVNGSLSPTSRKIDPQFVNPAVSGGNYRLQSTSPAVDTGMLEPMLSGWNRDLDGIATPQGEAVDIGAYELK